MTPWEGTEHYAVFDALKFDALKGYHQIKLDEESRVLTTFMTPLGRFCYIRLPFGLRSAGNVFTLAYGNAVDESIGWKKSYKRYFFEGKKHS